MVADHTKQWPLNAKSNLAKFQLIVETKLLHKIYI